MEGYDPHWLEEHCEVGARLGPANMFDADRQDEASILRGKVTEFINLVFLLCQRQKADRLRGPMKHALPPAPQRNIPLILQANQLVTQFSDDDNLTRSRAIAWNVESGYSRLKPPGLPRRTYLVQRHIYVAADQTCLLEQTTYHYEAPCRRTIDKAISRTLTSYQADRCIDRIVADYRRSDASLYVPDYPPETI